VLEINPRYQWNSLTVNSPDERTLTSSKIGIVKIQIWKSGNYTFTLDQHRNSRNFHFNQMNLTLARVKDLEENRTEFQWNAKGSQAKVSLEANLLEGEYVALVKCVRHHSLDLTQLNLSCYGEASASLAFLKTENNLDVEHYYDIINLSLWTNLIEQRLDTFESLVDTQ
jgi:hypothetical protein